MKTHSLILGRLLNTFKQNIRWFYRSFYAMQKSSNGHLHFSVYVQCLNINLKSYVCFAEKADAGPQSRPWNDLPGDTEVCISDTFTLLQWPSWGKTFLLWTSIFWLVESNMDRKAEFLPRNMGNFETKCTNPWSLHCTWYIRCSLWKINVQ